jgi:hypothetical protein
LMSTLSQIFRNPRLLKKLKRVRLKKSYVSQSKKIDLRIIIIERG